MRVPTKHVERAAEALGREHDELDAGDLDAVFHALRGYAPHDDEARKCVDYVERNRGRMHYAR